MRLVAISLAIPVFSVALYAEDYDTFGERSALQRQLDIVSPDKPLPGWHALTPSSRPHVDETPEQIGKRIQQLNRKLDSITVPQLDLQDLPFKDALRRLTEASKQNDPDTSKPFKGINIVIRFSKTKPDSLPPVNFNLENVTVREALAKLTGSNNLQFAVERYAVVVHDGSPEISARYIQELNDKLDSITIPQIDIQNLSLKEAVDHLTEASKENDAKAEGPYKGVRVVLKVSKANRENLSPVKLSLRNVPLREALVKLAASNKLQITVAAPNVVVLHD